MGVVERVGRRLGYLGLPTHDVFNQNALAGSLTICPTFIATVPEQSAISRPKS